MATPRISTRQRLLATAKDLFGRQGITQTTTRQIADGAGVHEVTLFRHFGSKQGLLLAVFADLGVFTGTTALQWHLTEGTMRYEDVLRYVASCFKALVDNPELVRSVVGEAGQYSVSQSQALQQGFLHAQHQLALLMMIGIPALGALPETREGISPHSHILHLLILGLAVMQVTCGLPHLATPLPAASYPQQFLEDAELEPIVAQWLEWVVAFWVRGAGLEDKLLPPT